MALAHKGLAVADHPWRFTEKAALAFSGQGRVPVIRDGERVVSDSWTIAEYLEDSYPDRPSLFGGATGRAHARFVNTWADGVMLGGIARLIVRDLLDVVAPRGRWHISAKAGRRASARRWRRCRRDGTTRVADFRASLLPVRLVLGKQRGWAARRRATRTTSCSATCSGRAVSAGSSCWRRTIRLPDGAERMLDLFDGLGRKATTV